MKPIVVFLVAIVCWLIIVFAVSAGFSIGCDIPFWTMVAATGITSLPIAFFALGILKGEK